MWRSLQRQPRSLERVSKDVGHSTLNAVNKSTAQIKKPSHRKNSPLNWFPRKKTDSYLERKIKLLQEVDGMNSTLDETLGDSNPHYSRVLREKIAAREAAQKAVEARTAALVEASWCRILRAARIESKEAEVLLLKAEKNVAEAFEVATAMGVIMYDRQDCPRKQCEIDTSTHTVTASLETAFEVDKEVAAAVKTAFIRLAHCRSSLNKDEFKDLLRKISQNPDTNETNQELPDCESDTGSEPESESNEDALSSQGLNCKIPDALRDRKSKNQQLPQNINMEKLIDVMFERLKCLKEDELASLATIVATCGLNAVLIEVENSKQTMEYFMDGQMRRKQLGSELPSLDKFLVKHMSRLEREVQEAKNTKTAEPKEALESNPVESEDRLDNLISNVTSSEAVPDLGSILVRHSSKLKKEIEEAKNKSRKASEEEYKGLIHQRKKDVPDVPSLDKFLVKHVSKLEREVQEARKARTNHLMEERKLGKENMDTNNEVDGKLAIANSTEYSEQEKMETAESSLPEYNVSKETKGLDSILVKRVHRLEREKMQALTSGIDYRTQKKQGRTNVVDCESLDKILVKHVPRLEREKMELGTKEEDVKGKRRYPNIEKSDGGLDQILVKHQSRLEKEKLAAAQQSGGDQGSHFESLREARKRDLHEAWGGLSLGNSMRPYLSRLERDKAAWRKAEEEEQIQARGEQ
ncbi:uncharacterized protein LOC122074743 isoform X2 [Macadamia integrifolia]|uniref:uncharacterized protein LOC122074743 isoform X2 n=1 Tax=Macadamia integrifolia TaxID=60698 RepID=UPI001C4FCAA0|nr:uncharacterized protein LOC122074743 isoform X2 [Macadamia integrifolia]